VGGAIDTHVQTAQIILLLVSADFLASDYCYDREMQQAMARHTAGDARVIPVILRPTDWHSAPFGRLQALPTDGRPITRWSDQDEAFLDVAIGIRAVAEQMHVSPIRVFLSAPSDVADERNLARDLLCMKLPYDPHLRGKVAFTVESWDNPAAPMALSTC
jgi:hypothetical protein